MSRRSPTSVTRVWPPAARAPATSGRRRSMTHPEHVSKKDLQVEGELAEHLLHKAQAESRYAAEGSASGREPILEVRDLVKHYPLTQGILIKKQIGAVKAVDGVSFHLDPGETLGVVGESG